MWIPSSEKAAYKERISPGSTQGSPLQTTKAKYHQTDEQKAIYFSMSEMGRNQFHHIFFVT